MIDNKLKANSQEPTVKRNKLIANSQQLKAKIQYISQGATPDEHLDNIKAALDAGVKWVQLRMKNYHEEVVYKTGMEVRNITLKYDATFIMNDYHMLVQHCDADGVHLGKNDEKPHIVRHILGEEYIIGATANGIHDIMGLINSGVNYIGLGPFRETKTKSNLSPILGLEGYEKIMRTLEGTSMKTPIIAIGGIVADDIQDLMQTGISGIALSGYLTEGDVKTKFNQINKLITKG